MKSTSPFNWKDQPSTIFTKAELAYAKKFSTTKNTERRQMNTYSKAKPAKAPNV
jgi:hypothetical protein